MDLVKPVVNPNRAQLPYEIPEEQIRDHYFDSYRFVSHKAHSYYLTGKKGKFGLPAEFRFEVDEDRMPPNMVAYASRRDLFGASLEGFEGPSSSALTKEFFSNLLSAGTGETQDPRWVYCRRDFILLTPDSIRQAYEIAPTDAPCAYAQLKENLPEDEEVLEVLTAGAEGARWDGEEGRQKFFKLHSGYLCPTARWWAEWVVNRILGIQHFTYIDYEAALIVYCLMKRRRIDIPRLIWTYIMERNISKSRKGFGYSNLIVKLARDNNIPMTDFEGDIDPPTLKDFRKLLARKTRSRRPPGPSEPVIDLDDEEADPMEEDVPAPVPRRRSTQDRPSGGEARPRLRRSQSTHEQGESSQRAGPSTRAGSGPPPLSVVNRRLSRVEEGIEGCRAGQESIAGKVLKKLGKIWRSLKHSQRTQRKMAKDHGLALASIREEQREAARHAGREPPLPLVFPPSYSSSYTTSWSDEADSSEYATDPNPQQSSSRSGSRSHQSSDSRPRRAPRFRSESSGSSTSSIPGTSETGSDPTFRPDE